MDFESVNMKHILHHNDRDGWGSAALLVSTDGDCQLYPMPNVNKALMAIRSIGLSEQDALWIIDLPAPARWSDFQSPRVARITWVDHHLASWNATVPTGIKVILPRSIRPTTTMSLLISQGIVDVAGDKEFVRSLCVPEFENDWALVFDGLEQMYPNLPVPSNELPALLANGPRGLPVPSELNSLIEQATCRQEIVEQILKDCPRKLTQTYVVIYLRDARGIRLAQYSLKARRIYPGKVVLLAHARGNLYCSRDSRSPGIDFIRHFESRGLHPTGHPYVCNVQITSERMTEELDAIAKLLGG